MYLDTITLFCRYESSDMLYWRPYVLSGVDLNADRSAILATYGEESQDSAKLHIAYTETDGVVTIGDYTYVLPMEYTAASGTLTMDSGEGFSFFYLGSWSGTTDIADDDYTDGFYNYMNATYDNVYAISSVAKYSVIPHFEVMAR